ncbi:MAG: sigma-54-dependent transcriptional regulator, partial [Fibrobacterota bacterium]
MAEILIVDDEGKMRALLAMALYSEGYQVSEAESGEKALELIDKNHPDVVISDVRMGGISGLELIEMAKQKVPGVEFIIMTAYADAATGVKAMRLGAYEYVVKPFEMEEMMLLVKAALDKINLRNDNAALKREISGSAVKNIIGNSAVIKELVEQIRMVASRDTTVLITGKSGTGKELIARALHDLSGRKNFVAVNCGALPENLLESELFGHEKGAFTGAYTKKEGIFEQAEDGSVFLDEIGELSVNLQVKLLRVLQERTFTRVGGAELLACKARIISATNRNIEKNVAEGNFREDLYYRLNVFPLKSPSLSERAEDIPVLAAHFMKKFSGAGISAEALDLLCSYSWPGNVRELENIIERAVILAGGKEIRSDMLPLSVREREKQNSLFVLPRHGIDLESVEKDFIIQALTMAGGNK